MLHLRFLRSLVAGIVIVAWSAAVSAEPGKPHFTGLYVFGDSLSDSTGNMFALSGRLEPPSPPYADGRSSNGPLWVEIVAEMLKRPLDAGNNRAVFGAFTDTRNSNALDFPAAADTGILSQVARFADDGIRIKRNDLVIVWGGANNYIFDPFADPALVVEDLRQAVEELADLGGRRFLVPNLPALGDVPLGNPRFGILTPEARQLLNAWTDQHNAALAESMAELAEDREVRIVVLDVHSAFAFILANPQAFGFVFTDIPCLIQFPDGTRLPTGVCPPDGAGSFVATGVMFWDLLHPTTAVHAILAAVAHASLGPLTHGSRPRSFVSSVREP